MRRRRLGLLAALLPAAALLAACATSEPGPSDPVDPLRFFDGAARSRGTVTTALVWRQNFTADFAGRRAGAELVLDERFLFPEGRRLQRWHLVALGEGRYGGTVETEGPTGTLHAPVPVQGRSSGNVVELSYDGFAPGGDARLHFRHRMTGRPDGTVENRVRVSKFGLQLAGATVVFERVPGASK